jgi:SAM-dependent methyltransferase
MTYMRRLQENWEGLAQDDALYWICSDPTTRGNKWDAEAFFASGQHEIELVLNHVREVDLTPNVNGSALDFGCGAGRLTQALAKRFSEAYGVDIAPTMIEMADRYNQHPETCHYVVNAANDLTLFERGRFAFVYSSIVLQHMKRDAALAYIREFLRVLSPDGVLVFQLPCGIRGNYKYRILRHFAIRRTVRNTLYRLGLYGRFEAGGEMNWTPERAVLRTIQQAGGRVVDMQYTNSAMPDFNGRLVYLDRPADNAISSRQYTVTRA